MLHQSSTTPASVIDFVLQQRDQALSPREWKHRLAGYGYAIRDTDRGQVVETLPHHVVVGILPGPPAN